MRRTLALALAVCAGCDGAGRAPERAGGAPSLLSETGLYADAAEKTLSAGVVPFAPRHELWSDGAEKRRFIALPAGAVIDTSAIDHWRFPVGTRVWKEFRRGGRRLETRFIERTGPGSNDYVMGAFVWDDGERDAALREDGARDVLGTDHDVPDARRCASCHGAEPGRVLGFSAVQLEGTATWARLAADRRLSHPPDDGARPAPGASAEEAALGYLHANCGHCHGDTGLAFRDVDLVLRLSFASAGREQRGAIATAVGRRMDRAGGGPALRIEPGRPEASGLVERMRSRAPSTQMPPLGTEHADARGLALVSDWIAGLSPARGGAE